MEKIRVCPVCGFVGFAEDAVEVVRCRDCKWWQDNNNGYPVADCKWNREETPDADDFCSCGERREDGE